jgi:hypothetical protein
MKKEIDNAVDILNIRGNSLFMACQLTDFFVFLSSGGICPKSYMEQSHLPCTNYDSDIYLKKNDCWDAHIFHLVDYGEFFYRKALHTPNPFGPILFHIKPDILKKAHDVSMTSISVRSEDFDPDVHLEPISADALNACYQYASDFSFPEKSLLKDNLVDRNNISGIVPEIVCRFDQEVIPFSEVSLVTVDHYIIKNRQFQSWIDEIKVRAGQTFPLMRRYCPSSTAIHLSMEIGRLLQKGNVNIDDICQSSDERLCTWGKGLRNNTIFPIFTKHLQADTLLPLYQGKITAETIDHLSEWEQQRSVALDNLTEKDAHKILTELAKKDPSIARRINTILK